MSSSFLLSREQVRCMDLRQFHIYNSFCLISSSFTHLSHPCPCSSLGDTLRHHSQFSVDGGSLRPGQLQPQVLYPVSKCKNAPQVLTVFSPFLSMSCSPVLCFYCMLIALSYSLSLSLYLSIYLTIQSLSFFLSKYIYMCVY